MIERDDNTIGDMHSLTIMSEDEWVSKFNPITESPIDHDELLNAFNGNIDVSKVWTVVDADCPDDEKMKNAGWVNEDGDWRRDDMCFDNICTVSGMHIVNKIGYIICENPHDLSYIEVPSDDIAEVMNTPLESESSISDMEI